MNESVEDRLVGLEKNCAYLEDRYEKLSEALISADKEIALLKRKIAEIETSLDASDIRPIERPPHY